MVHSSGIRNTNLTVMHRLNLFIKANSAESGPPLGTILGNLGVNTVKFCKEFNDFTKDLPNYFVLKVQIIIFDNRTFNFSVRKPSAGYLLKLLKFNFIFKIRTLDNFYTKNYDCISINNMIQLAKFIFPSLNLRTSLPIIKGNVKSAGLWIIYD